MKKYPANYKDKFGKEETQIYSDGSTLYITLRGIKFEGIDFESLEGQIDKSKFEYVIYENGLSCLTNFELTFIIPVNIVWNGKEITEHLAVFVATENNHSVVRLKLETKFRTFVNEKEYSDFESAIVGIQKKLPDNTKIKTCLSCKYSNYHPVGNGMLGGLICFKNLKEESQKIRSKNDLMKLLDKVVESKKVFNVQETFVCNDHEFVTNKDWVYKNWMP